MKLIRMWKGDYGVGTALLLAGGALLAGCSFCSFGGAAGIAFSLPTGLCFAAGFHRSRRPARDLFLSGTLFHLLAIYWLPDTLALFGGFPAPVSWMLFLLFALVSSIQFALVGAVAARISRPFAFALAWGTMELLIPRLFPWSVVHALIGWRSFSGLAELCGEPPLSTLFLVWAELVVAAALPLRRRITALAVSLALVFAFGFWRERSLGAELEAARPLTVALVQGNLSTQQKGDVRYLSANLSRYRELSRAAELAGAKLVIWPESVMNVWTPEDSATVRSTPYDPNPDAKVPLLYGTLSFRRKNADEIPAGAVEPEMKFHRFNTAVGVNEEGSVLGVYHKKVLMPFGEYLPFSATFPIIKKLSPHSGDFSVGDREEPIRFSSEGEPYLAWSLICYEDLVPSLSRLGARKGAELLINLTNDAWYGKSEAPYQHHLLASWRAIENRRYLLRSTNTGLTAVVTPFGETVQTLPLFDEGILVEEVRLLHSETVYARIGDLVAWILCGLTALLLVVRPAATRPASARRASSDM